MDTCLARQLAYSEASLARDGGRRTLSASEQSFDLSISPGVVRRSGRMRVHARSRPVREAQLRAPNQKEAQAMRFMMIVKASKDSEAGVLPTEEQLAEMAKYNEELVKAGVLLAAEGLHASAKGARVRFSGAKRTVIDGPFTEAKELIAGFWLIQAKPKEEAIEWAKRVPFEESEIEVRQVFELEDFGPSEAVEHHAQLREQIAKTSARP